MEKSNTLINSSGEPEIQESNLDEAKALFLQGSVKSRKSQAFKVRVDSAISSTGLSQRDFYIRIEISRQEWYYYAWGITPFPSWLKIKLCDTFGKPFRDLFLQGDNNGN